MPAEGGGEREHNKAIRGGHPLSSGRPPAVSPLGGSSS